MLPADGHWVTPPRTLTALVKTVFPGHKGKASRAKTLLAPFRLMPWPGGTREQWTLDLLRMRPEQRRRFDPPAPPA
jgi:hypothetical protein